jgi:hypothetical protein
MCRMEPVTLTLAQSQTALVGQSAQRSVRLMWQGAGWAECHSRAQE